MLRNKKIQCVLSCLLSFALMFSSLFSGVSFAAHDDREIYSLATDQNFQSIALGETGDDLLEAVPNLNRAGNPTLTIVEHPHAGNSILVSERSETWHALDIDRVALNLEAGNLYTIRVSGRVVDAEVGTQVILGGADSPWGWLTSQEPAENGDFSLTLPVNSVLLNDGQVARAFRIQTNDHVDFIVDEIVVTFIGTDNAWTPPGGEPGMIVPTAYGNVLRVETTAHQQWDGVAVPITALDIEAGNIYRLTMDLMIPDIPDGGLGLLVQTDGNRFEHIVSTNVLEVDESGEWIRVSGELDLSNDDELDFSSIQIVKDGNGPNTTLNTVFLLDNFAVERVCDVENDVMLRIFDFENEEIAPFVQSGTAFLSIVPAIARTPILNLTFGEEWLNYEVYVSAGIQMEGERMTNFGHLDDYAFRLENVTGDYTSGAGNYLRLDLSNPLSMGGTYEISWWVYVPVAKNLGNRDIIGPGIVFNSTFGSPAHQPTNTQPAPGDVQRRIPTGEWVQTSIIFDLDHATGDVEHLIFRFRTNDNIQQPTVYFIDDIQINRLDNNTEFVVPEWDLTLPSLAEIYSDLFLFGNILEPNLIQNNPRGVIDMFLHHYNALTAENAMKPDAISGGQLQATRPEALLLDNAETMVNFALDNDLYMVGHTLIWHEQSARWQYLDVETGEFLTRDVAMENMRWFIEEYAGHFEGRIDAWDVTNEVFTNSGGANNVVGGPYGSPIYPVGSWQRALRNYVPWYHAFANGADFEAGERGWDYIYYSYVFARRYAPSATLIYNDFNEEFPAKRNAIANMVEEINERWANDAINNPAYNNPQHSDYGRLLIEAIGMQAHYNQNTNMDNIRQALDRFIETGARIHITELDIQFTNIASPFEMSEAQLEQQATMFAQLFVWYMERAEYIDRVSIWGREDGSSWRGQNGATHFDRNYNPKPSFWAIVDPIEWLVERDLMEAPTMLEVPMNLQIDDASILTWDEVDNAHRYRIYIEYSQSPNEMVLEIEVNDVSFALTELDLVSGDYFIQIRAIGDRVNFADSNLSERISYRIESEDLRPPVVIEPATIALINNFLQANTATDRIEISAEVTTESEIVVAIEYVLNNIDDLDSNVSVTLDTEYATFTDGRIGRVDVVLTQNPSYRITSQTIYWRHASDGNEIDHNRNRLPQLGAMVGVSTPGFVLVGIGMYMLYVKRKNKESSRL